MSTAKAVAASIRSLDMTSREAFGQMMDEVNGVIPEPKLAVVCETSLTAVRRWVQKRNTPSPLTRKAVQTVLINHLTQMQS